VLKPQPFIKKIEGLEHTDKVIDIDQSPIGRTPRSNWQPILAYLKLKLIYHDARSNDSWLQSGSIQFLT
jgi:excinuclease UvrABC ATPase subunit